RLFQPKEPWSIPHGRAYKVTLRTAHLMAISILVGGHAFSAPVSALRPWLYVAIATGVGMILFETGSLHFIFEEASRCAITLLSSWRWPAFWPRQRCLHPDRFWRKTLEKCSSRRIWRNCCP